MEYENIESAYTDTGDETIGNEPETQLSVNDENATEIETEPDSEIFTSSETESSSETIESSEIADSSETETEPDSEIFTSSETIESSEIADSSETWTETETEPETESADSPESSEIADSSETETATESAVESETNGTLTILDDDPHGGENTAATADSYLADMITALNGQLYDDRERMSEEHVELMERLDSMNTTATLCVGVLLCILLCTGALFGANLARTFWERLRS